MRCGWASSGTRAITLLFSVGLERVRETHVAWLWLMDSVSQNSSSFAVDTSTRLRVESSLKTQRRPDNPSRYIPQQSCVSNCSRAKHQIRKLFLRWAFGCSSASVYPSIVVRSDACRRSSCTTLASTPNDLMRSRSVCHPPFQNHPCGPLIQFLIERFNFFRSAVIIEKFGRCKRDRSSKSFDLKLN